MNSTIYKKKSPLLLFLIPAFVFLIVFLYYPFLQNIINSFSIITGLGSASKGLNEPWYANYVRLATDKLAWIALKNTLLLTVCTVVFQVGIALVLALMVDSIHRGAKIFRTVYFFPIVISATALGLMFNLIFLYNGGMVNQLLQKVFSEDGGAFAQFFRSLFKITGNVDWKDENHFLFTMFLPIIWQYVGFYFVILVTGLNNIPTDIYEAARIDGSYGLKMVRLITLPMLKPVIGTCVVLAVTGALKVFDLPWVMFGSGMPMDKSWLTGTYMYNQTFIRGDVDYGSTIAILIVVLGVIFANLSGALFKKEDM